MATPLCLKGTSFTTFGATHVTPLWYLLSSRIQEVSNETGFSACASKVAHSQSQKVDFAKTLVSQVFQQLRDTEKVIPSHSIYIYHAIDVACACIDSDDLSQMTLVVFSHPKKFEGSSKLNILKALTTNSANTPT